MADETIWPNNLKPVMDGLGLKQADLVRATGWNKQNVGRYYNQKRKITVPVAKEIAQAINVDWQLILDYDAETVDRQDDTNEAIAPIAPLPSKKDLRPQLVHRPEELGLLQLWRNLTASEQAMLVRVGEEARSAAPAASSTKAERRRAK